MNRIVPALLSLITFTATNTFSQETAAPAPTAQQPRVRFETTHGSFTVELDSARAPRTVENFLKYVRDGHYSDCVFHRVIESFVAQAGGYGSNQQLKKTRDPIPNESGNGLTNRRGTIAMARTESPHSATSQFYINLVDNPVLDPQPSRWGYTVFGEVIEGMDVLDRIGHTPTGKVGAFTEDAPLEAVIIKSAQVL